MRFGARLAQALERRGPVMLGIDPHPFLLAAWGLRDDVAGLREFSLRAIDAAGRNWDHHLKLLTEIFNFNYRFSPTDIISWRIYKNSSPIVFGSKLTRFMSVFI